MTATETGPKRPSLRAMILARRHLAEQRRLAFQARVSQTSMSGE